MRTRDLHRPVGPAHLDPGRDGGTTLGAVTGMNPKVRHIDDDTDGAQAAVWMAGGTASLTWRLIDMLHEPWWLDGPRRWCAVSLGHALRRTANTSGWSWGRAHAHAAAAGLEHTADAIAVLATNEGATTYPGIRWPGDAEAAVYRAIGHEAVEAFADRYITRLITAGLDDRRANHWLHTADPLLEYASPLDRIRAGHTASVDVSLRHLLANLSR